MATLLDFAREPEEMKLVVPLHVELATAGKRPMASPARHSAGETRTKRGWAHCAWIAACAFVFSGCNVGLASANLGETPGSTDASFNLDASSDTTTQVIQLGDDASDTVAPEAPAVVPGSSPLCHVATDLGCDPDKLACVFDATDAGADSGTCTRGAVCNAEDGGPPVALAACRVVAGSSAPLCSTAYGAGDQDARCTTSADCNIGFECMGGAIGAIMGTCKHYCCGGNAACSALDPNWFCDIETVFHGINLVPVCTLIEPCVPFDTECPTTGDTCTLVNETTRQTACVTPGLAAVGDACAKEKCGANLACISGACKQLCKLMGTDGGVGQCPSGQTCVANSLFGAYAVGLCSDGPAP